MRQSFLIVAVVFGVVYFALERYGLFGDMPGKPFHVLYSLPVIIDALLIFVLVSVSSLIKRNSLHLKEWTGFAALFFVVSGLWAGHFTRFNGEVILTEGQTFYSGHGNYLPETIYRGRFSVPPDFTMKLEKINPLFSGDGKEVKGLNANAIFFQKDSEIKTEHIIGDGLPGLIDGAIFNVKDFGYSPRYLLKTKNGRVLDSSFVYMKLFPPGSEGFFRLLSPITYHVRYFPDGKGDIIGPAFRLRIVRNKDIVQNRDVKLSEEVEFENSRISFEEVRMWTRLSVKRDWGEVMALGGVLLGIVYLGIVGVSTFRSN